MAHSGRRGFRAPGESREEKKLKTRGRNWEMRGLSERRNGTGIWDEMIQKRERKQCHEWTKFKV